MVSGEGLGCEGGGACSGDYVFVVGEVGFAVFAAVDFVAAEVDVVG